jgi:hypothetical protein
MDGATRGPANIPAFKVVVDTHSNPAMPLLAQYTEEFGARAGVEFHVCNL